MGILKPQHCSGGDRHRRWTARFNTVGLPDSAVKESRERVAATIKNSGFYFPTTRIKANLAPADVRKEASAFDLPIALGVFAATAQIRDKSFDQTLVCQVLK